MSRRFITTLIGIIILIAISLSLYLIVFKRPYDTPEIHTISPSQTAFLIPLEGDSSNQAYFESEALLAERKVASKRVQIPHRWLQTGRLRGKGEWIPTMQLIVVERKPVTREWTESPGTGTSNKNQGISAESKNSIGFIARMNASAQIDEKNTPKFLYRYNNTTLEEIMDTEIRAKIESKFVEECAKYELQALLENKEKIMTTVRDEVISYFKDRGITITTLGLKGEFTYLDSSIQKVINDEFAAKKKLTAQKAENERKLSAAEADAKVVQIQKETLQQQIKLQELDLWSEWIEKWDGKLPQFLGGEDSNVMFMPNQSE